MEFSRRTFIGSAAAATAWGALSVAGAPGVANAASPPGDVVGKITVGYQGWFACAGDGAPINGWWHWSQNWSQTPSPSNNVIKAWPDMREYPRRYPTAYQNFGNGEPATLFSSYDQQTVDTHFLWMQENGCDTAALQRNVTLGRKYRINGTPGLVFEDGTHKPGALNAAQIEQLLTANRAKS